MAKKNLNDVNRIINQLEKLKTEVDTLRDKLQEKYDNLSDFRQESDYGDDLQVIMDSLDAASFDGLSLAIDELRNAAMYLDTLTVPRTTKNTTTGIGSTLPLAAGLIYLDHKLSKEEKQDEDKSEPYDPYDNHWETSFDWVDEDNDGYDDRDDGFLG